MTSLVQSIQELMQVHDYVSRETNVSVQVLASKLAQYVDLVQEANQQFNLTGAKTGQVFFEDHVVDSLLAAQVFLKDSSLASKNSLWIDVGSGAGLPGLVWALLKPKQKMLLVESKQKKAAFLQKTANFLGLNQLSVSAQRFEELSLKLEGQSLFVKPEIKVVSRGTASPEKLIKLVRASLLPWKDWYVFSSSKTHEDFLRLAASKSGFAFSVRLLDLGKNPFSQKPILLSHLLRDLA